MPQPRWVRGLACVVLMLAGCIQAAPPALQGGTVTAVSPADMPAENTGAGGVAGAVAGGVAGAQFGSGLGKALVIVGGVVAGSVAGTAVETSLQNATGLQYVVRLDDGQMLTIVQHHYAGEPVLPAGARVQVETSGWVQRVVPVVGPS